MGKNCLLIHVSTCRASRRGDLSGGRRTPDSRLQAALLGKLASELHLKVEPGSSNAIRFPGSGPYDERLVELSDQGLFSPCREKDQAGLALRGNVAARAAGSKPLPTRLRPTCKR